LPFEPDHVDEQAFGQTMAAHDGGRETAALVGEMQAAIAVQLDVAVIAEPADGLRHRSRREPQSLDQAGAHRHDAFFLDGEDRLEVFLGRVVHLGHRPEIRENRRRVRSFVWWAVTGGSLMAMVTRARARDRSVAATRPALPR